MIAYHDPMLDRLEVNDQPMVAATKITKGMDKIRSSGRRLRDNHEDQPMNGISLDRDRMVMQARVVIPLIVMIELVFPLQCPDSKILEIFHDVTNPRHIRAAFPYKKFGFGVQDRFTRQLSSPLRPVVHHPNALCSVFLLYLFTGILPLLWRTFSPTCSCLKYICILLNTYSLALTNDKTKP